MKAQIKEKREIAKGTLLATFDLLGEEVDFMPGQYFFVTLPDVGHQDEKGLRRHITVVTSPRSTTIDLYSVKSRPRIVTFQQRWLEAGTHRIVIRALGTKTRASAGTRVDVDAFAVVR